MRAVYNVPAFERSSTNEHAVATSEEEVHFNFTTQEAILLRALLQCERFSIGSSIKVNCASICVEPTPQRNVRDDELQFDAK